MAGDRPLPNAVSVGDELLVALIGEVRGLRDDVQALRAPMPPESSGGEVELREPKPASRSRSRSKKQA